MHAFAAAPSAALPLLRREAPLSPPVDEETAALALRARQGDRAAFGALYERYAGLVHGVLLSLVSVAEAQDLVQEVFLAALRRQGHLEDPGRFGAWIASIARNRGRDALRARREVEPLDAGAGSEPAAPAGHAAEADDAEEAARALEAVRSLPEAYREPLLLRLVEGLSGPEIANRTGMTHGSVRVNLCRGMKLLRERLAAEARSE